jgi:hypothetical protein
MNRLSAFSTRERPIWRAGPWYVRVNHWHRCTVHITGGDVWFPISRPEAAKILRQNRKIVA